VKSSTVLSLILLLAGAIACADGPRTGTPDATAARAQDSQPVERVDRIPRLLPAIRDRADSTNHGSQRESEPAWLANLLAASDRIALGRVRALQAQPFGPNGERGIFTRVELQVEQSARGDAASVLEFWTEGGVLERRARVLSTGARFRAGETAVVFLRADQGTLRLLHGALGKWSPASSHGLDSERFTPAADALAHMALSRPTHAALAEAPPAHAAGAAFSPLSWDALVRAATQRTTTTNRGAMP
jgi:hypothetical protein